LRGTVIFRVGRLKKHLCVREGALVQYHCKALKGVCVPPYVASWAAAGCNEVDPSSLLLGVPRLRGTVIFRYSGLQ
jgi:hypothetical protein